jgi:hypothetical protein
MIDLTALHVRFVLAEDHRLYASVPDGNGHSYPMVLCKLAPEPVHVFEQMAEGVEP